MWITELSYLFEFCFVDLPLRTMEEILEKIKVEAAQFEINSLEDLENYRLTFLTKKSKIQSILKDFRNFSSEDKKKYGKIINQVKGEVEQKFNAKKISFEEGGNTKANIDYSLPTKGLEIGNRHPISIVQEEIIDIFGRLGFKLAEGPEIEDDWHNFSALNFPEEHPARDMQDTFFITDDLALRTHTSSVQVRVMENNKPPIRIIAPGRVYRNEAVSMRSNSFFHQLEGLVIDEETSFADMKQVLYHFVKELFGERPIRFRASYFPFTEPSAEMDIYLGTETENDKKLTKGTGWLEVLGCGMIDPNVLENANIDSNKYSGYAFGLGIDRLTMLRYGIKDIRDMFDNDMSFLSQFKGL